MRITVSLLLFLALSHQAMSQNFKIQRIPQSIQEEMFLKGTIAEDAPVGIDRLRLISVPYLDFHGKSKKGQLIVLDVLASAVGAIFVELYEKRFPIAKMELITVYGGDDDASMADNNTSAHNYRKVAGSARLSLHAYGTAIDINPVQNPYILLEKGSNQATYLPPNSIQYANRLTERLGKPYQRGFAEDVVDIFAKHGYYWWGGYWDTPIDYQHFQLDRDGSYVLANMPANEAHWFFQLLKNHFNEFEQPLERLLQSKVETSLLDRYQNDSENFKEWVESNY